MSEPLQRVVRADQPLTLASVPSGFLPWLAADLARAAFGRSKGGRAVVIAADESAMRALAETVPLFAPEVEVLTLPGWDCLPYDRASPALRVMAERLATLSALQTKTDKPQLLVATAQAVLAIGHQSGRYIAAGGQNPHQAALDRIAQSIHPLRATQ